MFADDVLLFSKAHPPTQRGIMQVLRDFQLCTILQANQAKSQAIYGGCTETLIEACQHITGFSTGTLPLRYLGLPLTSSRLTKIACRALVDKITRKVQLWSSRSLSFLRGQSPAHQYRSLRDVHLLGLNLHLATRSAGSD